MLTHEHIEIIVGEVTCIARAYPEHEGRCNRILFDLCVLRDRFAQHHHNTNATTNAVVMQPGEKP